MNATRQGGALGTLLPGRPDARREQINRVPRRFDEGDARSNGSATRSQRPSFGLLVVSALLLLTAAFGRQFSKLELGGVTWLHPTEVALLAVAIWPVVSGGVQDWIRRLRESGVLVPLLVL